MVKQRAEAKYFFLDKSEREGVQTSEPSIRADDTKMLTRRIQ